MKAWRGLIVGLLLPSALSAETAPTGLQGRTVSMSVLAYNDPAFPIYVGQGKTVTVGQGVEFGLDPEGVQNGADVAPATVDISANRIEVSYRGIGSRLISAKFNGYVLAFAGECALFDRVSVDRAASNMALAEDAITMKGGTLYVNLQGLSYTSASHFALDIKVADCPIS